MWLSDWSVHGRSTGVCVVGAGMRLRFTQRRTADGWAVRRAGPRPRVDSAVKPQVLMNLGRVDRADVDGLLRQTGSIAANRVDPGALRRRPEQSPEGSGETLLAAGSGPTEVVGVRPIGATHLHDGR